MTRGALRLSEHPEIIVSFEKTDERTSFVFAGKFPEFLRACCFCNIDCLSFRNSMLGPYFRRRVFLIKRKVLSR